MSQFLELEKFLSLLKYMYVMFIHTCKQWKQILFVCVCLHVHVCKGGGGPKIVCPVSEKVLMLLTLTIQWKHTNS